LPSRLWNRIVKDAEVKYLPNSRLGLVGNLLDGDTPLKINMKPKNEGLEDDVPFQTGDFQVP